MGVGDLKKKDPREVWEREDSDFTPWLAKRENWGHLEEVLDLYLSNVETERQIGRYHLDFYAQESGGDRSIIVENQLEESDHAHLGKLLTYAANAEDELDADVVVWIAKEFKKPHQQAVEWLNIKTDNQVSFFALELRVYQIDGSPPAVKMEPVVEPEDWSGSRTRGGDLSETKRAQEEFWTQLAEKIDNRGSAWLERKNPQPNNRYSQIRAIKTPKDGPVFVINSQENLLKCDFELSNAPAETFAALEKQKKEINSETKTEVKWLTPEDSNRRKGILRVKKEFDLDNRDEWETAQFWLIDRADEFCQALDRRLLAINSAQG